jgi:hypothetical protein
MLELWRVGVWVGHSADCLGAREVEGCAIIGEEKGRSKRGIGKGDRERCY